MTENPLLTQWLQQEGGLAGRLRGLRERAGLTGAELAELIGCSTSTVSRAQNGLLVPGVDIIESWCWATRAPEPVRDEIVGLARQATARHIPWRHRVAIGHSGVQAAYTELHRKADCVLAWGGPFVPGPFQTPGYATAMIELFSKSVRSPLDVAAGVEQRQARTEFVGDGTHNYRFVFTEAALLSGPCDDQALFDQIAAVAEHIGEPGVDLRVIPLRTGLTVAATELFSIYTVADVTFVICEHTTGEVEWTDPDVVDEYDDLWWRLAADAVRGDDLVDLLAAAKDRVEVRLGGTAGPDGTSTPPAGR